MLDQETLDDLVSLAKRVENQVSKRALRAIATREIAAAFEDCGILKVVHHKNHSSLENNLLLGRVIEYAKHKVPSIMNADDVLPSELYECGLPFSYKTVVNKFRERVGCTRDEAETFLTDWAGRYAHKFEPQYR